MLLSTYISLRAVASGLVVVLILVFGFGLLWSWGAFGGQFVTGGLVFVVGGLLYACGGYVAGALANRHEVLNALIVGLLFGVLLWLAFRFGPLRIPDGGSITADVAGFGAGVVAVLACGVGGVLAALVRYWRRSA